MNTGHVRRDEESPRKAVIFFSGSDGKREILYRLTDPFCIFYLRFVKDSIGNLNTGWVNIADSQPVVVWRGYAFENVGFNHIRQIKFALGISGVSTSETLWSKRGIETGEGTQVDLIVSRKDNIVDVCEFKFYSDVFTVNKDYHFVLIRRKKLLEEMIPRKAVVHNVLITTYGLKFNEYSGDFINTITLDDLFAL